MKEETKYLTNNAHFNNQAQWIAGQIKNYLIDTAKVDNHLAECLEKPNKDFGNCMIYVMNMAYKNPEMSSDDACYQNARHYYLEDNISEDECTKLSFTQIVKTSPSANGNTISEKDIEKIKKEAVESYKAEIKAKEEKKAEEKKQKEIESRKKKEESSMQMSLFDFGD